MLCQYIYTTNITLLYKVLQVKKNKTLLGLVYNRKNITTLLFLQVLALEYLLSVKISYLGDGERKENCINSFMTQELKLVSHMESGTTVTFCNSQSTAQSIIAYFPQPSLSNHFLPNSEHLLSRRQPEHNTTSIGQLPEDCYTQQAPNDG